MLNLTLAVSRKYYFYTVGICKLNIFFYKKDFKFSKFYQKIWYIFFQLKINILKIEKNWYCDLTIKRDIKLFVNIFHLSSLHLLNDQVLISWDRASLNWLCCSLPTPKCSEIFQKSAIFWWNRG